MMKISRENRRQPGGLLSRARWAGYAAAGAMTVVGAHETADAGIFYSGPLNERVDGAGLGSAGDFFAIDFDNDGQRDFRLRHWATYGFAFGDGEVWAEAAVAAFRSGTYIYATKLNDRDFVSAKTFASYRYGRSYPFFNAILASGAGYTNSRFLEPGEGYVGFRFDVGQGQQYGWMKVNMDGVEAGNTFTVLGYAYAEAGESIYAGQVPEPGSLGLLATGAAGLLLWRRLRRGDKSAV